MLGDIQISQPYGGSNIVVTTTGASGGCIGSVKWKGIECVNSTDHGRDLQISFHPPLQDDPPGAYGDEYDEAGSASDPSGASSTTILGAVHGSNWLATSVNPARWMPHAGPNLQSSLVTHKSVTFVGNVMDMGISVQGYTDPWIVEAPTGYMPSTFDHFYTYDPATGIVAPLAADQDGIYQPLPLIVANWTQGVVWGIVATGPGNLQYGAWLHCLGQPVTKWNCNFTGSGYAQFDCKIVIGSMEAVKAGMATIT